MIKTQLPPDVGFCLVLYNFGPGGFLAYLSNAERSTMIEALREMISNLEGN